MRLAQARAEEAVLRTHVDNVLIFVDTLVVELPFDRAIETYMRVMGVTEPLAGTIANRVMVILGQDLVTPRRRSRETDTDGPAAPVDDDNRPRLRLNDAESAQRRGRTGAP